jgi:hypothetical protein
LLLRKHPNHVFLILSCQSKKHTFCVSLQLLLNAVVAYSQNTEFCAQYPSDEKGFRWKCRFLPFCASFGALSTPVCGHGISPHRLRTTCGFVVFEFRIEPLPDPVYGFVQAFAQSAGASAMFHVASTSCPVPWAPETIVSQSGMGRALFVICFDSVRNAFQ